MGTKLQVVAAMAVVGSVAGGGVALAHVPAVQQTAATASQPSDTNGQALQSLLAQSAKLHAEIERAREGLTQPSADAATAPRPSASTDDSTPEPAEHPQAAPTTAAATSASTAPAIAAPAKPLTDDDGREDGGHNDGGEDGHETNSAHTADTQPAPTSTRAPGGGDD